MLLPESWFPSTMKPRRRESPRRKLKASSRRKPIAMGVTTLVIEVANPGKPAVTERLGFTVDSGAVYKLPAC
jgi:hypothetical protein